MLFFHGDLAVLVALSCFATTVAGSFSSSGADNIAIYWGQNSHGAATGTSNAQQRLSFYCSIAQVDIIPLAFLNVISSPSVNFANAGDNCTAFSGSTLLGCSQLEEDIQTCQSKYGKTIMLSVGGATYTEGGFRSSIAATSAADNIWAMFGPVQSNGTVNRPFGKAVVDGFDFDFESSSSNMAPFASALRSKMDVATAAGDKPYYLSAAPQCPYPDAADKDMLAGSVYFDFVMVQFYNNYCGLPSFVYAASKQNSFNFDTWDRWAKTSSKNPNVRVLLGIPGSSTAAGTGYTAGSSLTSIISYCKQFASFGGIMMWDMSQVHANAGFLDQVVQDLGSGTSTLSTAANTTAGATVTTKVSEVPTGTTLMTRSSATIGTVSILRTLTTKSTTPRPTSGMARPTTFSTITISVERGTRSSGPISSSYHVTATNTVASLPTSSSATRKVTKSGTGLGADTSTVPSSVPTKSATPVQQWRQCGGIGYNGLTQCQAPFTCVRNSVWWAECQ